MITIPDGVLVADDAPPNGMVEVIGALPNSVVEVEDVPPPNNVVAKEDAENKGGLNSQSECGRSCGQRHS